MIGEALYTCASFCCFTRSTDNKHGFLCMVLADTFRRWEHALHAWDQGINSEKNG